MRRNELLFDAIGSIEDSLLARTEEKERKTTRPLCAQCGQFVPAIYDGSAFCTSMVTSCCGKP